MLRNNSNFEVGTKSGNIRCHRWCFVRKSPVAGTISCCLTTNGASMLAADKYLAQLSHTVVDAKAWPYRLRHI